MYRVQTLTIEAKTKHLDYIRFVIVSTARSGTEFLRGLLNAHTQVITFGELFREYGAIGWSTSGYRQSKKQLILIQNAPVKFLERIVYREYPAQIAAVGFKIFYYHARNTEWESVWQFLRGSRDIRVIHLKRKNLLAAFLSFRRVLLTNRWTNAKNTPEYVEPLVLEYKECVADFVATKRWQQQIDTLFKDSYKLEVIYEDLAANTTRTMRRVQEFLHVDRQPVKTELFKQNRQSLSDSIANYDELKVKFAHTQWSQFFDD